MVLLDLAYIHHWMDFHVVRHLQFTGIIPNHSKYWEGSHILGFESACLPLEFEIPG